MADPKYPYPNGYISYMNAEGQTVNPWTGQTTHNVRFDSPSH
jgi:hypothetical protein